MTKNRVNESTFKGLVCRTCEECKKISEVITPGFNMYQNTGYTYIITCSDGLTRDCEVGSDCPTNCMKFEDLII